MLAEGVTLTASFASGVIDAFTGEIPEYITIPLIVLGLIYAYMSGFFTVALLAVLGTFLLGYMLYYTGELGGGDVLLLAGISAWMPMTFLQRALEPYLGPVSYFLGTTSFVLLVVGLVLSSMFYSVFYSLQIAQRKRTFLLVPIPYFLLPPALAALYGSIITAYLGQKYRDELFVRERAVKDLLPEDVLAEPVDVLPPGKKVLEKADIERLKREGVEKVRILDNLPRFGPFIFLALILVLVLQSSAVDPNTYASRLFSFNVKLYP